MENKYVDTYFGGDFNCVITFYEDGSFTTHHNGKVTTGTIAPKQDSYETPDVIAVLTKYIPNLTATIIHPVYNDYVLLRQAIISLNDICGWSRVQIADWLETLDLDLTFQP